MARRFTACAALATVVALFAPAAHADTVTITTAGIHKAADLRDAIGVNGHPDFGPGDEWTGNAWQSYTPGYGAPLTQPAHHTWKSKLCDSGIKLMRAALKPWPDPWAFGLYQVNDLYRSCGVRFILTYGEPEHALDNVRNLHAYDRGAIAAVEGGNEMDLFYWHACRVGTRRCSVPEWATRIRDSVRDVHGWLTTNGFDDVPILAPSFVNRLPSADPGVADAGKVGDLSAWVDFGNAHPYSGGLPPEEAVDGGLTVAGITAPGKRAWFTEFGFNTAPNTTGPPSAVSEWVQANYLVRGWLDAFDRGVAGSLVYELLDEFPDPTGSHEEQFFGLVRRDWTEKPAYHAARRLLDYGPLRDDETDFAVAPTKITVSTPPGVPVRVIALQNSRGQNVIALWRPDSLWHRDQLRPLEAPVVPITTTVCRPDVAAPLQLDAAMPVTGAYHPSFPAPRRFTDRSGVQGCSRFTGNYVNAEPQVLFMHY